MVRRRRALLRVLPEFDRPRNEYIHRALRNLFDLPTRWTWSGRSDTAQLINAFSSNEAFRSLTSLFGNMSVGDPGTLYVELDLLAKVAKGEERVAVKQLMSRLLSAGEAQLTVLRVAIENDISVPLGEKSIKTLRGPLWTSRMHRAARLSEFSTGLSSEQVIELAFSRRGARFFWRWDPTERSWLTELRDYFSPTQESFDTRLVSLTLPPFMLDRPEPLTEEAKSTLSAGTSDLCLYLQSLARAVRDPTNAELAAETRGLEGNVQDLLGAYSCDMQLGPGPENYESVEHWKNARGQCSYERIADAWLRGISTEDESWLTACVHPDAWDELKPVVKLSRFDWLDSHARSLVRIMSPRTVIPARVHFPSVSGGDESMVELCRCLVGVVARHGVGMLTNSVNVFHSLARRQSRRLSRSEAEGLLEIVKEVEVSPHLAGLVMRLCSTASGLDVRYLLRFWQERKVGQSIGNVSCRDQELIEQSLTLQDPDAVRMAAFLASRAGAKSEAGAVSELGARVTQRLCDLIRSSTGEDRARCVALLLEQEPDVCEIGIWADPSIYSGVGSNGGMLERFGERLCEVTKTCRSGDVELLSDVLSQIVQERMKYPSVIAFSALEALLGIKETSATPLTDGDWQLVVSRECYG